MTFNRRPTVRQLATIVFLSLALAVSMTVILPFANYPATAQTDSESSLPDQVVIFVIDLSGSMNRPFDEESSKLDVAKEAFAEAFRNVSPDAFVGIRVYGDQLAPRPPAQREQNCTQDSRLVVPISLADRDALIAEVQDFKALGDTPIGLALRQANDDIPDGTIGTVILFSDGRDECFDADLNGDPTIGPSWGESPCLVAQDIAGEGVDLRIDRIETVGFQADKAAETELRCIADSTGGSYTPIESPEDARAVLPKLLAEISSPREAERLGGVAIEGTPSEEGAPAFSRLDPLDPEDGRYTDSIEMNSEKWYRVAEYGPGGGTLTATVFGLPAQEDISFTMRLYLPSEDRTFFDGRGDDNAGIPRRPTASIRCPGCSISGGPHEVVWILSLQTENPSLGGVYDLEVLTEGSAFGGDSLSCTEPQECWYEQTIDDRTVALDELQAEYDAEIGETVPQVLTDQRDALVEEVDEAETASREAQSKATALKTEAAVIGTGGSNFLMALILAAIGLLLGGIAVTRRRPSAVGAGTEEAEAPPGTVIGQVSHEIPAKDLDQESPSEDVAAEAAEDSSEASVKRPAEDLFQEAEAPTVPAEDLESKPPTTVPLEVESPSSALEVPESGWYEDPEGDARLRWWDGDRWTDNYDEGSDGE